MATYFAASQQPSYLLLSTYLTTPTPTLWQSIEAIDNPPEPPPLPLFSTKIIIHFVGYFEQRLNLTAALPFAAHCGVCWAMTVGDSRNVCYYRERERNWKRKKEIEKESGSGRATLALAMEAFRLNFWHGRDEAYRSSGCQTRGRPHQQQKKEQ